jgi:hypothetical protein
MCACIDKLPERSGGHHHLRELRLTRGILCHKSRDALLKALHLCTLGSKLIDPRLEWLERRRPHRHHVGVFFFRRTRQSARMGEDFFFPICFYATCLVEGTLSL